MRAVAVAGPCAPQYELSAADLVVPSLANVSYMNLKQLFAMEIEEAEARRAAAGDIDDDQWTHDDDEDEEDGDGDDDDGPPFGGDRRNNQRDDAMFGSALW